MATFAGSPLDEGYSEAPLTVGNGNAGNSGAADDAVTLPGLLAWLGGLNPSDRTGKLDPKTFLCKLSASTTIC